METTTITTNANLDEVPAPVRNTEFKYMYRDGSNNKNSGSVVLTGVITPELEQRLLNSHDSGINFIAKQVSVPEVFLWDDAKDYDPENPPAGLKAGEHVISDYDHCWHEFTDLCPSSGAVTDKTGRTVEQLVAAFESAAAAGWDEFDPYDRAPAAVQEHLRGVEV
jgi:hypothetical protein